MYKNPNTGYYEHDFRVAGVPRYHISYGVTKKADAERLHATAVALFRARKTTGAVIEGLRRGDYTIEQLTQLREAGRPFTDALEVVAPAVLWPVIGDAMDQYLEGLKANPNRTDNTYQTAKFELGRFTKFLAATGRDGLRLDEITSPIVEEYQASLVAAGLKQNTSSACVSRVGSVFHWFRRREDRTARETRRAPRSLHIPLDPETISREKTSRLRYLSEEEAQRLLAATPRMFLFPVAAGLFGGFRIDEMCHFRTQFDVDLELGVLSVQKQPGWKPKTKRSVRHVPIADALRPIVERHLERYASDDWMTPAMRDPRKAIHASLVSAHFRRIVDDAELVAGNDSPEGVTYHTLRHTFASWSLMRGTDVFTVAKLLGNTVQQIENTYGHLALDFRKAAVDRLSGAISMPSLDESDDTAEAENTATENATTEA